MTIDRKTSKDKKTIIILTVITIIYMFFIWIHSSMSAEVSTEESTAVLGFIDDIFRFLGISLELTDHIIRKTAHFCEFALLGTLVLWTSNRFNRKIFANLLSCGFICLATATIDETIQLSSPGRAGMVTDILLDFSGVIAGFLFFILVYYIIYYIKRRGKDNE